jgi:outer membrane protein
MTKWAFNKIKTAGLAVVFTTKFCLWMSFAHAQQASAPELKLSLKEAIALAKTQNITVRVAQLEQQATQEEVKDARNSVLPAFTTGAGYERDTKLTLFQHGLHDAVSIPPPPTANVAYQSTEMAFNLYSGGITRALIQERQAGKGLADINFRDQAGNTSLQLVVRYLELVRLINQRTLISDQSQRARTRVKTITALYKNERVTRSDVLRAELLLSNVGLDSIHNQNDIAIASNRITVLLHLPDTVQVMPADSANMNRPGPEELDRIAGNGVEAAYAVQRTMMQSSIQAARVKGIKGNSMPTISLVSAYGFSYPNYLDFPPVDQLYSIGYVGIKVSYSISSRYQNTHKVASAQIRLEEIRQNQQLVQDNTREQVKSLLIRYKESLNRIAVSKQSIEQATVNYRIVNTKYFNQLALLTDLLDADNLYQEARYDLISAETDASLIYYNLLYATGNL